MASVYQNGTKQLEEPHELLMRFIEECIVPLIIRSLREQPERPEED
jgi:hypothetical protein